MTAISTTEVCLAGPDLAMASLSSLTARVSATSSVLASMSGKLYHMGFRSRIARSTLATPTKRTTGHLRRFRTALDRCRQTAACRGSDGCGSDHSLYALDSTTIDLCLALFPWRNFANTKCGEAAHALDLHGNIPTFYPHYRRRCTRQHPREILPERVRLREDRGYIDFERLLVPLFRRPSS